MKHVVFKGVLLYNGTIKQMKEISVFRQMRRIKQQQSDEVCISILEEQMRGALAVHGEDGYPYAFPMDYIYKDGKIYFHCAREGHKIDALKADNRVSFCVYNEGFRREGEWALNITSVVIFGRIRFITDENEALTLCRKLGEKYIPTGEELDRELERSFKRVQMLELTIDHMTGKLVNES